MMGGNGVLKVIRHRLEDLGKNFRKHNGLKPIRKPYNSSLRFPNRLLVVWQPASGGDILAGDLRERIHGTYRTYEN
jgi:hypothetical protein